MRLAQWKIRSYCASVVPRTAKKGCSKSIMSLVSCDLFEFLFELLVARLLTYLFGIH